MAETYSSEILRIVIAQIAQTIGYSNTQSAPLELLEDILQRFIQELARDLHSQAEHANRVEPNLKDVQLSLKNLSTDVHELLDYIGNVEPVPFVREVSEYPVKRSSNLNFLKPGSAETLSRPVHIFEYLPPILPTEAGSSSIVRCTNPSDLSNDQVSLGLEAAHKFSENMKIDFGDTIKPNWCNQRESPLSLNSTPTDNVDSDGHAVREISSVVMTTGGFISPAIEGKLPEAVVPDIIEKWKGLDAPPTAPPPEIQETESILPTETFVVDAPTKVTTSETRSRTGEQSLFTEISPAGAKNETNCVLDVSTPIVALQTHSKSTKKSKKKHLIGGLHSDHSTDLNASKAQDKAHRKALRMFQKLSKTQADGDASSSSSSMLSLKKSMKNLNRGILSSLPDKSTERTQLEKLIKKQTKQRQKQLKSQKQQRQLQLVNKTLSADGYSAPAFALNHSIPLALMPTPLPNTNVIQPVVVPLVGSNTYSFDSPSHLPVTQIEKKEKLSPEASSANDSILDEMKLASEPDRNKLNIFKKLSKPKATPKAPSPMRQFNIATNLFGNASNGSPLINLPSGTTITPAPALNVAENVTLNMPAPKVNVSSSLSMSTYDDNDPNISRGIGSSLPSNSMVTDVHRPKKRGRKPGGKNCVRSTELTPKKLKSSKTNLGLLYPPNFSLVHSLQHPLPVPAEPLNLSHVNQFNQPSSSVNFVSSGDVGTSEMIAHPSVDVAAATAAAQQLKCKRVKEKKERKKAKAKYNQFDQLTKDALDLNINKKFDFNDADNIIPQTKPALTNEPAGVTDKHFNQTSPSKSPGGKRMLDSSPPMIGAGAHSYMAGLGALPLLPFPPRPGLIPSGLFSPTSIANFGKKVNCPNKMMSLPFLSLPVPGRSSTVGYRPTFTETAEYKSGGHSVQHLAESPLERSYCNVAPLVPDSMKLTSFQIEGSQSTVQKSGDSATLKSNDNGYSSILSKYGAGLLGLADPSTAVQSQATTSTKTIKQARTTPGTGNLGDPIEVSDDSNDDASNAHIKKENKIDGVLQKSSILQPINLQQQFESSHTHSTMIANSLLSPTVADLKQLKKLTKSVQPIKINHQIDSNSLSVGPSSSLSLPSSHSSSSFNINFMGNDKFSLAGGADLIPLSCVDSGLAYSSKTVPVTSLAAGATSESSAQNLAPLSKTDAEHSYLSTIVGSVKYDDITITPTKASNELKLHKLHKRSKKPKEGKIKKKKDKKDKTKSKEKSDEKNLLKVEKPKGLDKKQKKEKKKEKLQIPPDVPQLSKDNIECSTHLTKDIAPKSGLEPVAVSEADTFQTPIHPPQAVGGGAEASAALTHHLPSPKLDLSPNQVPKLTLKLGGKSTPIPPNQSEAEHDAIKPTATALTKQTKREQSPELARFSPLVTGPPKPKQCETQTLGSMAASVPASAPSVIQPIPSLIPNTLPTGSGAGSGSGAASNSWITAAGPACAPSSSVSATLSASSVLLPQQLLQASQPISKMPLTSLSTLTQSQQSVTVSSSKSEGSSVLLPQSVESNRPSSYVDAEGYRIWICPACGKVDDGSPMIGCDGCDAWYHWVCVGILVAPNDNEDWFCRVCITKKKVHGSEKKKKRNKKK